MAAERPFRRPQQEEYDVAILGGGLAGLTLGLQLTRARPGTTVFVAEKRPGPAPEAAFKVGESTVELSCHYFGEVIGLKDHLERDQVPKCGLRFFFPADDNSDISQRVEYGVPFFPPVPSFQLDRGRFENELARRNLEAGVDLVQGAFVDEVDLEGNPHHVTIVQGGQGGERTTVRARWVVDASGRSFILKHKLGLLEPNEHAVNSSWFRLAGGLNIEDWVDEDDDEWFGRMKQRGWRRFSTNHLCGEGYWVWLIPLSSGPISIGIVADPRFHPWERINTLEGALDWLREHEPQLAGALDTRRDQVEDFLVCEHFSYGCKQVYSSDRWCLTGEAGPFLDPFYSPGSDAIAMGNTFTTDLITRDLDGEDIAERADAHNDLFLKYYKASLVMYEGQYGVWGNPQVMTAKITCNNIFYWSTMAILFFHSKFIDREFAATVWKDVNRIWRLNARLEQLFREWHALENREWRRAYVPTLAFPPLGARHLDLEQTFDDDALRAKIAENAELMEAVAVAVFRKALDALNGEVPDEQAKINPYAIGLRPERWEEDGLFDGSGLSFAAAAERTPGLENLWMERIAQPA
jgi:flavin-dependent dehydrogenase